MTCLLISVWLQNFKEFWPKILILEGKNSVVRKSVSLTKIGHDFSNKVIQKLTLEKNVFNKLWSPRLISSNEKNR